jgi:para-nitrobenzyl esterase
LLRHAYRFTEDVVARRDEDGTLPGWFRVAFWLALPALGAITPPAPAQSVTAQTVTAQTVTAQTHLGPVTGSQNGGLLIFKGIPYAAPPVGDLRWRPARDPAPWQVPRAADEYGPSCLQPGVPDHVVPGTRAATTREDCLYLNVWAPAAPQHPAPVIVWLHGGGNRNGTASQTYYDGSAFARDGVVLVSFNYRLGELGFLAHSALLHETGGGDANFGLTDQIAALAWVRRNIAAFGGDPANVTVMGESAGGEDILDLLASPAAKGLFHKAIVESAGLGWDNPLTLDAAGRNGIAFATRLGIDPAHATPAALRAIPADAILKARRTEDGPDPILDGRTLTLGAVAAFRTGKARNVPMLIGTNGDEALAFGPLDPPATLFPALAADELARLRTLYGPAAADDAVLSRFLLRDAYFTGPARAVARANAAHAPTFVYRFDYIASLLRARRPGAPHGSEIPFVFETGAISRIGADDTRTAAAVHGCWTSFARTGTPTCAGLTWPAYTGGQAMLFADPPTIGPLPQDAALDLLDHRLRGAAR